MLHKTPHKFLLLGKSKVIQDCLSFQKRPENYFVCATRYAEASYRTSKRELLHPVSAPSHTASLHTYTLFLTREQGSVRICCFWFPVFCTHIFFSQFSPWNASTFPLHNGPELKRPYLTANQHVSSKNIINTVLKTTLIEQSPAWWFLR